MTLLLLSAGKAQCEGKTQPSSGLAHLGSALRKPLVWAPLLAAVLALLNLHLPAPLQNAVELLGSAAGGVALFASGVILFSRRVSFSRVVGMLVFARNIVVPALAWGIAVFFGMSQDTIRETVLTLAIPTGTIAMIVAVQYQTEEQEMASMLFFSTVLSVVTLGVFIGLTA